MSALSSNRSGKKFSCHFLRTFYVSLYLWRHDQDVAESSLKPCNPDPFVQFFVKKNRVLFEFGSKMFYVENSSPPPPPYQTNIFAEKISESMLTQHLLYGQ